MPAEVHKNSDLTSMLHDKAFDVGIITIAEDMTVRVSKRYTHNPDSYFKSSLLCYHKKPIVLPKKFQPNVEYLSYHREHIFEIGEQQ